MQTILFKVETTQIKEEILKQGLVSHMKLPNYCGGNLILTSNRIFFKSADPDFQQYQLNFPFSREFKCKSFSLLGFIKNAIRIQNGNKIEVFFLEEKQEWLNAITEALSQNKNIKE